MKYKQKYKVLIYILITLFLLVLSVLGGQQVFALADTSGYSSALTDLQKDSNFDINEYPSDPNDYSIQVIQVAESETGCLYVYTYQPCQLLHPITATRINMSLTDKMGSVVTNEPTDNDEPKLYSLTLINTSGVFGKYKVDGFAVSSETVRNYNIASIYRDYDETLGDSGSSSESIIKEVAFPVGKLYTVRTENNNLIYDCVKREVVIILNPYADYLRFYNGWKWYHSSCDMHYVAFSTDWDMNSIISANISFKYRSVSHSFLTGAIYGAWQDKQVTIYETDTASNPVGLYNGDSHTWNRIDTVENFIAENSEDLKDSVKEALRKDKWIFCFYETEYTQIMEERYIQVGEVAILRLKFRAGGKVYNLGAVSDLVSEDEVSGNKNTGPSSLWDMFIEFCKFLEKCTNVSYIIWAILFIAVPVIVVIIVLCAIFPPVWGVVKIVLKAIGTGLLWVLKGLWWLVCLPFKGIAKLIKKE